MGNKRNRLLSIVRRSSVDKVQDDEPVVCLQVGKTMWENVPKSMRTELWMSVLHRRGLGMAATEKFNQLLAETLPTEVVETIDKDMARTYPDIRRFAEVDGQKSMARVLRAYAAHDPEVGYCQGMNFLAGMLLMYIPDESHAFGALVVLMYERGLRELYNADMSLLQVKLWQLGRLMPQDIRDHLEMSGCLPVLFASSWILTSFASDFPYQVAGRILDVLMADSFNAVVLKVALVILVKYKKQIMRLREMEAIVHFLSTAIPAMRPSRLHEIVSEALATPWSAQQLGIIGQTSDIETIQEAVARVENGMLSPRTEETKIEDLPITSAPTPAQGPSKPQILCPPTPSSSGKSTANPSPVFIDAKAEAVSHPPVPVESGDEEDASFGPYEDAHACEEDLENVNSTGDGDGSSTPAPTLQSHDSWSWVSAEAPPDMIGDEAYPPMLEDMIHDEEKDSVTEAEEPASDTGNGPNKDSSDPTLLSDRRWLVGVGKRASRRKNLSTSDIGLQGFEFKWIDAVVKDMKR